MAKHNNNNNNNDYNNAWIGIQKRRWVLVILALFSLSTAMVFFMRPAFDSCSPTNGGNSFGREEEREAEIHSQPNPLEFMKSKLVLLVSHELSLSGTYYFLFAFVFFLFRVVLGKE